LKIVLDYKSQKLKVESAEDNLTIARSGFFPTLSASYGFTTSSNNVGDLFSNRSYNFGLSLSLPIFSNWNTEYSLEYAEVQVKNEKENLHALERSIKIELQDAYLQFLSAKKKYEVSSKNVISARQNRKVNIEKFNLGSTTMLQKLQADKDYTQAQTDMITSKYDLFYYKEAFEHVIGNIDPNLYNDNERWRNRTEKENQLKKNNSSWWTFVIAFK